MSMTLTFGAMNLQSRESSGESRTDVYGRLHVHTMAACSSIIDLTVCIVMNYDLALLLALMGMISSFTR